MSEARIGIFGGTFNPVHDGHLSIAREALLLFRLAGVWFIPCSNPPHKPARRAVSASAMSGKRWGEGEAVEEWGEWSTWL